MQSFRLKQELGHRHGCPTRRQEKSEFSLFFLYGHKTCGKLASRMNHSFRTTTDNVFRAVRVLATAIAIATTLASVPVALTARDAGAAPLDGDAEFLQQLEEAKRLEAELAQLEAEAQAARERELDEERREISERNALEQSTKEERLREQIESEMDMQSQMLGRKKRNETAQSRDLLGAHALTADESPQAAASARMAPDTPQLRDLPRAIFSEKSVTVPARSQGFNNTKKLKVTELSLDADGDGKPEVVRYLDRKTDAWILQREDRNYDGQMDSLLKFERGKLTARELDSNDNRRPDIFERYVKGKMVARSLDRDDDGVVDAFYDYKGKYLSEERHDADNSGDVDLIIEYRNGRRAKAQEDTDRDGRPDTWTRYGLVGGVETVTHIEIDKGGRGFADTYESFDATGGKAVLARREEDLDGDGEIDLVSIYTAGKLVRREILKPEVVPL